MKFEDVVIGVGVFFGVLILAGAISLIFAYPAMLLWNYVMPVLGVAKLSYWQMVALNYLSAFLVKSYNFNTKN